MNNSDDDRSKRGGIDLARFGVLGISSLLLGGALTYVSATSAESYDICPQCSTTSGACSPHSGMKGILKCFDSDPGQGCASGNNLQYVECCDSADQTHTSLLCDYGGGNADLACTKFAKDVMGGGEWVTDHTHC
jgi:hypothetical protein